MFDVRHVTRIAIIAAAIAALHGAPAAAEICNLTTALNTSCGPGNPNGSDMWSGHEGSPFAMGAIFQVVGPQPTGTGYIDSFLRIQENGTERGYNTNFRALQFDEKNPINYTHAITLGEVPVININGINYRQFFLDINQSASPAGQGLSLDQLKIFVGGGAAATGYSDGSTNGFNIGGFTGTGAPNLVYDMDTGACTTCGSSISWENNRLNNWIQLSYDLIGGGSGQGDMVAYVPDQFFAGYTSNQNVYLYSQFGTNDASDAGFEEWWVKSSIAPTVQTPVPEPASLLLMGSGLLFVSRRLNQRKSRPAHRDAAGAQTKVAVPEDLR